MLDLILVHEIFKYNKNSLQMTAEHASAHSRNWRAAETICHRVSWKH